ncbi:hypothetical protein MKW94_022636, partial [Papaver nudicaule]|nr:hypothetical protein [Papaver nudicaule]
MDLDCEAFDQRSIPTSDSDHAVTEEVKDASSMSFVDYYYSEEDIDEDGDEDEDEDEDEDDRDTNVGMTAYSAATERISRADLAK